MRAKRKEDNPARRPRARQQNSTQFFFDPARREACNAARSAPQVNEPGPAACGLAGTAWPAGAPPLNESSSSSTFIADSSSASKNVARRSAMREVWVPTRDSMRSMFGAQLTAAHAVQRAMLTASQPLALCRRVVDVHSAAGIARRQPQTQHRRQLTCTSTRYRARTHAHAMFA